MLDHPTSGLSTIAADSRRDVPWTPQQIKVSENFTVRRQRGRPACPQLAGSCPSPTRRQGCSEILHPSQRSHDPGQPDSTQSRPPRIAYGGCQDFFPGPEGQTCAKGRSRPYIAVLDVLLKKDSCKSFIVVLEGDSQAITMNPKPKLNKLFVDNVRPAGTYVKRRTFLHPA
jgi:hypothetical protein